jgi:hypothetical protein
VHLIAMEALFKIEYRLDVLRLKWRGLLPQLNWAEVASMLAIRSGSWPVAKLAVPSGGPDPISPLRFETAIGDIYWAAGARQALALLVLDRIRTSNAG